MSTSTALYAQGAKDELAAYVQRLKESSAKGGSETAFMSVGSDFLYAQEYFEAGNYSSAEYSFANIVRSHKDHAFANYQLAISLIKQNNPEKAKLAQEYLEHAFALNPSLKARFAIDVPARKEVGASAPATPVEAKVPANSTPKETAPVTKDLEDYIERLKHSYATGGQETQIFSAGQEAILGIQYYEKGEFRSAETSFGLSLARDAESPYANYLMAVSLAAQGKEVEAKPFLQKATAADNTLVQRYAGDVASGKAKWNELQAAKQIKTTPVAKVTYGGALVYGDYVCTETFWNGPNANPLYRYEDRGYFALKKDGTYRWLDNGGTGKYSYNSKTGAITWLSGPLKDKAPKASNYQPGTTVAQVTVDFEGYSWECGCNK
ncbi:hypothetical protein PKOR_14230 [Pontibacter korlensis]|uniref:Tetratricopeptide repeat protein n=2 Tax=Pontibacter korlensis TaxID=400092 RepID=A0A0E3ZGB3_9BACT|nr:hypothetical protein PKOR_14230 [Pontibacter korlensis]